MWRQMQFKSLERAVPSPSHSIEVFSLHPERFGLSTGPTPTGMEDTRGLGGGETRETQWLNIQTRLGCPYGIRSDLAYLRKDSSLKRA